MKKQPTPYATGSFPPHVYVKSLTVRAGGVQYEHDGESYSLGGDVFSDLEGLTVLVDSGLNVFRGDKRIGKAERQ